ncbi:helix-turn-helix domain-containing protein [Aquimarina agarilytica]|uniref:helix-turn-helix domain-containing protein n=1 Tax=Aquimarina agarilytica TaxID=1087449 RepID=UPI00028A279C|nr:helix-turn-helix domain-containing protein [Aquimarina agarilytica]
MEVIVFESEAYKALQRELMQQMHSIIKNAKEEALRNADPAQDWISTDEAKKLLGVKSKTKMQELRDMGELIFSQSGRIIKYSKTSILNYLNRNIPEY